MLIFLWRGSNDKPSASRSLCRLPSIGMSVNNFMLDQTGSSSAMYFSVSFWWILFGGPDRPKRLDGNVCFCPSYIVTTNPPKRTLVYPVLYLLYSWKLLRELSLSYIAILPPSTKVLYANFYEGGPGERVHGRQFVKVVLSK